MSSVTRAHRRRLVLALVSGLLLVTLGASGALAQSPSAGPDTPVSGNPPVTITSDDAATPAFPDPTVTGAQPIPFDHVTVGPDGRTLTIYYWHGVDGCYGLKEVTVSPVDGGYAITIWAGLLPEAVNRLCIDMAQLYSYQVVLDQPVLTFGGLD